jgi:hypothetical protein
MKDLGAVVVRVRYAILQRMIPLARRSDGGPVGSAAWAGRTDCYRYCPISGMLASRGVVQYLSLRCRAVTDASV